MGNRGKGFALGFAACACLLGAPVFAGDCRDDQLKLRGDWGQARFSVEVADDEAERNLGLMFRKEMPTSAGMLFVYPQTRDDIGFWMRNTLIPLDMIFADETGIVQHIHENAVPMDETPIMGGPGIRVVLEVNGGMAARLGITEGSEMQHPAIASDAAAWPC